MNSINKKITIIGLWSSSLYVAFQCFANILSTKITVIPFLKLAIDGGTVIYPFTFILRDLVHKTWGKRLARQIVIIAGILNVVMISLFWLIDKMPSDSGWANQAAYETILLPVTRIAVASILAQVISELVDTEIFSLIYHKINDVSAVLISNAVSLTIDSLIFCFVAFLGHMPFSTLMQIVLANVLIKAAVTFFSTPLIKLVPRTVEFDEI